MSNWRKLQDLLGLDNETVTSQIQPHLESFSNKRELQDYLDNLLGPGPTQQAWSQYYLNHKFPPPPPSQSSHQNQQSSSKQIWGKQAQPTASSVTRKPPPAQQVNVSELEKQFGTGGKVYIKNRDDEVLFAGTGKKHKGGQTASGSVTPTGGSGSLTPTTAQQQQHHQPIPSNLHIPHQPTTLSRSVSPSAAPSTSASTATATTRKGKSASATPASAGAKDKDSTEHFTSDALKELEEIDGDIKSLSPLSNTAEKKFRKAGPCFCQARLHPLSTFTPLCPRCSLALCQLHPPLHACPSCTFSPLLPAAQVAHLLSQLSLRRSSLFKSEKDRHSRQLEQEARERAAIRFPTLGSAGGGGAVGPVRNYASHAGGGPGMLEVIDKAYDSGPIASRGVGGGGEAKVLRLDGKGKSKKVKVGSLVVKEVVAVSVAGDGKEEDEEGDETAKPFFDTRDDGAERWQEVFQAIGGAPVPYSDTEKKSRPFLNVTLDEKDRPVWVADGETVQVEEEDLPGEKDGEKEGGDGKENRPTVPGAKVEEEKKKRRRGGGGKGKKEKVEGEAKKLDGEVEATQTNQQDAA
ncbi:hypothetical protein T439DRAFT_327097 [Meredithblackwellia eburnea MCA 4105]